MSSLSAEIGNQVASYGSIKHIPAAATPNMRNDMYMGAEGARLLKKSHAVFSALSAASSPV